MSKLLHVPAAALAASALAFSLAAAPARAAEEPRYNQVELEAAVSREVPNDLMTAALFAEANAAAPAEVAATLNRATAEAVGVAAKFEGVKVSSGQTHTYPVYDRNQKLVGWRGRAEIRLESRDFQAIAQLAAKLQPSMQLGGIAFAVSPELRRRVEDELVTEAIAAFRARADVARRALGGQSYRVRRVALNTGGVAPPPRAMAMARAAPAGADAPPPVFEGGETRVQVVARGTIEVE
ncbi:MAG: SIMPL domain-containing protein [Burkholderiales bacterium]|nr:SIMPL domain-containing protein [Burkholderiales bacterium]